MWIIDLYIIIKRWNRSLHVWWCDTQAEHCSEAELKCCGNTRWGVTGAEVWPALERQDRATATLSNIKAFPRGPEVGMGLPGRGPSLLEHLLSRSEGVRRGRSSRLPAGPRWRPRGGRQWAAGALEPRRNTETGFDCVRVDGAGWARCHSST